MTNPAKTGVERAAPRYMGDPHPERETFEKWYVCNVFDYERNPVGSILCAHAWDGWRARAALRTHQEPEGAIAAIVAAELATLDGYDPADQHGGLYDLRWSGGSSPEALGDAWNMDYLPKGERIAAALTAALLIQQATQADRAASAKHDGQDICDCALCRICRGQPLRSDQTFREVELLRHIETLKADGAAPAVKTEQVAALREQLAIANARGDAWRVRFNADTDLLVANSRDAARYRHLRTEQDRDKSEWMVMQSCSDDSYFPRGADLDTALDASIAARRGAGHVG